MLEYKEGLLYILSLTVQLSIGKENFLQMQMHCPELQDVQKMIVNLMMRFILLKKIQWEKYPPPPTSWEGNKYIIVFVCHFSGWPECSAVKDKSANTVAKLMLEQIIPHHSCPLMLYIHNGTEFINEVISIITSTLNICHLYTSPYHPSSNGKVDRFNRYLGNSLAKYCKNNCRDWDQYLNGILWSYISAVHDTSKYTPFYIMNGRQPILPLDTLLVKKLKNHGEDYLPTILQELSTAF